MRSRRFVRQRPSISSLRRRTDSWKTVASLAGRRRRYSFLRTACAAPWRRTDRSVPARVRDFRRSSIVVARCYHCDTLCAASGLLSFGGLRAAHFDFNRNWPSDGYSSLTISPSRFSNVSGLVECFRRVFAWTRVRSCSRVYFAYYRNNARMFWNDFWRQRENARAAFWYCVIITAQTTGVRYRQNNGQLVLGLVLG